MVLGENTEEEEEDSHSRVPMTWIVLARTSAPGPSQGAVVLGSDEMVYLSATASTGSLASSSLTGFLSALGTVSGTGRALVLANDGVNSGLYYLNDFGGGSVEAANVRMLGLFQSTVLQSTDISLP